MKAKFTKGEWNIKTTGHYYNGERQYKHEVLVDGIGVACFEDSTANAHLIAAAPDMYEMLEILTHTCRLMASKTPLKSEFEALQAGIEQVLSKARGE